MATNKQAATDISARPAVSLHVTTREHSYRAKFPTAHEVAAVVKLLVARLGEDVIRWHTRLPCLLCRCLLLLRGRPSCWLGVVLAVVVLQKKALVSKQRATTASTLRSLAQSVVHTHRIDRVQRSQEVLCELVQRSVPRRPSRRVRTGSDLHQLAALVGAVAVWRARIETARSRFSREVICVLWMRFFSTPAHVCLWFCLAQNVLF